MTFAHVSVRSSDLERSIRFYEAFLGMRLASRRPIPQNRAEIAFVEDPDGTLVELIEKR
ncbi:MAG: hypothetical protein FJ149_00995 [Euryarchaeota archaeon]|nr:hypothetical protein [Euryarchaeota archaeon]